MFKFVFYMSVLKTKLSGAGFVRFDSGREPDLLGSESDMFTVHARSKICPCVLLALVGRSVERSVRCPACSAP